LTNINHNLVRRTTVIKFPCIFGELRTWSYIPSILQQLADIHYHFNWRSKMYKYGGYKFQVQVREL